MSYKPEESELMAYLYDELTDNEKKKIEAYLAENEDARRELEELRDARTILSKMNDREVAVPSFVFDESPKVVAMNKGGFFSFWRNSMAIAASISIIILVGFLTKVNLSWGDDGMQLSFGNQPTEQSGYTEADVQRMIQSAIAENNQLVNNKLESVEQGMKQLVSNTPTPTIEQKQIDAYMEEWRIQSIETLAGLLESSELSQKEYTDQVLREFAIFLDIQRQNDMNVIQTRFDNLIDDTELNQMQTNRILTNLLSSSGEPSNQY